VQHPFTDFAAQHNYAQSQAQYDWVLFVDADERVSPELADEISRLASADQLSRYTAYHIERVHLFSGRWLFSDPARRQVTPRYRQHLEQVEVPRLINRRVAVWERPLHETVRAPEPHGVLNGVIYHYASTNLSAHCESFNSYTDREAAYLHQTLGRTRVSLAEAIARGIRAFLYVYLWWGWWKFGEQGLLMAITNSYAKFMNYAKLSERLRIHRGEGIWTEQDRRLLERFPSDRQQGE
jgi:glycosyltransferase involved in cell wall biosynthesis